MPLREIPMVRLLIPLIVGIVLAPLWYFPDRVWVVGVLSVVALVFLLWGSKGAIDFSHRTRFGVWAALFFLLLGTLLLDLNTEIHRPDHCSRLQGQEEWFKGIVTSRKDGKQHLRLIVALDSVGTHQKSWQHTSGKVLVYIPINAKSNLLGFGQAIQFRGELLAVAPPLNPKAFDYRRYLRQQNVYNQIYVDEDDWRIIDPRAGNPILRQANRWRNKSIDILRQQLPTADELGVGMALILGNKSEIEESLQAAYANTGAMHVLAVSGLHIGMVYLGLGFILGLIPWRHRYWKAIKVGLTLLGVWSFALITGGSPSVLRAATMFSFLIIGLAFSRFTNIYNTLAASAFVLLCINPLLLKQVGFQLSYLAVFGIVYFQPRIYRQWYIKNRLGNYLWKLISVSLAAQITTFPLSLFYFHQFPLYFWLSGLVVVPAAVVILTVGLTLLILSKVPLIGWLLGKILYAAIWMTNALIYLIQQLPAGLIKGIWIGGLSLFLMYVFLVFLIGFLEKRTAHWVMGGLTCLCALLVSYNVTSWNRLNQREITIYQIYKHTLIDLFDGKAISSLADAGLEPNAQKYAAANYRMFKGGEKQAHFQIDDERRERDHWIWYQQYLQFDSLRLAVIDPETPLPGEMVTVDYVLLRNSPNYSVQTLQKHLRFKALIFDGSNYRDRIDEWAVACKSLELEYYNLPIDGALTIELSYSQ